MQRLLYIFPAVGTACGAYVSHENATEEYNKRVEKATKAWQQAKKAYEERDMTGSKEDYRWLKGSLHLAVKETEAKLSYESCGKPGKGYYVWGGLKGALFPVTVPYYVYQRQQDSAYCW